MKPQINIHIGKLIGEVHIEIKAGEQAITPQIEAQVQATKAKITEALVGAIRDMEVIFNPHSNPPADRQ